MKYDIIRGIAQSTREKLESFFEMKYDIIFFQRFLQTL